MPNHTLHFKIGEKIKNDIGISNNNKIEIILDPACGGNQNIPLFLNQDKSNSNECCNVDILILKNKKIKIIIEIEEANIKPTQICGKFLTSAISKYYIHKNKGNKKIGMDKEVCFIQIVDTKKLKNNSSKIEQFNNIKKSISNVLPIKNSRVIKYKLFYLDSKNDDKINDILNKIKKILKLKRINKKKPSYNKAHWKNKIWRNIWNH